jgi:hypothetical protein
LPPSGSAGDEPGPSRLGRDQPVAARALGGVEAGVGLAQRRVLAARGRRGERQAQADRDGAGLRVGAGLDRLPELVGHPRRGVQLGSGQQHEKLLAAPARDEVALAQAAGQAAPDAPQHPVADGMAEVVVDLLEVIHVDQHHGARLAAALQRDEFELAALVGGQPVRQAGQRVMAGEMAQLLVGREQLRRAGLDLGL